MNMKRVKKPRDRAPKRFRKALAAVVCALAVLSAAFTLYISSDYDAWPEVEIWLEKQDNISPVKQGYLLEPPDGDRTRGVIFYPGAKVEETAYLPLLDMLAEEGILCVCVHMPFQMAFLAPAAAADVMEEYPEVERWYLMGHSLGGAMAADFAGKHPDRIDGLILLAAYSAGDLRETGLDVLTVYGSGDGVLNREKYQKNLEYLPDHYREVVVEGGNHAQFGLYGPQKGDGEAAVGGEEQRRRTAEEAVNFIRNE